MTGRARFAFPQVTMLTRLTRKHRHLGFRVSRLEELLEAVGAWRG
jgi:hypothetical protein